MYGFKLWVLCVGTFRGRRRSSNNKNDFTPEEEEEVPREN